MSDARITRLELDNDDDEIRNLIITVVVYGMTSFAT